MSIKKLFSKEQYPKVLKSDSISNISSSVESREYMDEYVKKKESFLPRVDYQRPENFARYGSAEKYYLDSIERIYSTYPYDGSAREKLKWQNESLHIDKFVFDEHYPRTTGYITLGKQIRPTGTGLYGLTASYFGLNASDPGHSYIHFKGGPHASVIRATQTGSANYKLGFITGTLANKYNEEKGLQNNLRVSGGLGTTVEFWLKKGAYDSNESPKQVVFDLWNSGSWGLSNGVSASYGRYAIEIRPGVTGQKDKFYIHLQSGSSGIFTANGTAPKTDPYVALGTGLDFTGSAWHHYAITTINSGSKIQARLFVDGEFNSEIHTGSAIGDFNGVHAQIGALVTKVSASVAQRGFGRLSGSMDEFRFWKVKRNAQQIGRYWKSQVGGGTNIDDANTKLGVYFKFNEGISTYNSTDAVVLDYSGRMTNGTWVGYDASNNRRFTGSAINEASASAVKEFRDPIIYSYHPDVISISNSLKVSGSNHDHRNVSMMWNSIPEWIRQDEEDAESKVLKSLLQVMASYFDTLQLQMESFPELKNVSYVSGTNEPLPFSEYKLESMGFEASEIFVDSNVLEQFMSRGDEKLFEKDLYKIKNLIYENIYNNLLEIYKSKGTLKSIRNFIRCFGIDDELIKLNTFADNFTYTLEDRYRETVNRRKFINFNSASYYDAVIYQQSSSANPNSARYFSGSHNTQGPETSGSARTVECEVLFPKKFSQESQFYQPYPYVSASLFGVHSTPGGTKKESLAHPTSNNANYQVYAIRDRVDSKDAYFAFTTRVGGSSTATILATSSVFKDVYDNSKWLLSVRVKPEKWPIANTGSTAWTNTPNSANRRPQVAAAEKYTVELHGIQTVLDEVENEFIISGALSQTNGSNLLANTQRFYVGAHRTNFTGSVLEYTDVKIGSLKVWNDYLEEQELKAHALDSENISRLRPTQNTFMFQHIKGPQEVDYSVGSNFYLPRNKTLALWWRFDNITGSDATGKFIVDDHSSGSINTQHENSGSAAAYGWAMQNIGLQNTGLGFFPANKTSFASAEYINDAKQQMPETLSSLDMVSVLDDDDVVFTRDQRPIKYMLSIEKNMYQTISEEMLNFFAGVRDYGELIGRPVEKYRQDYKSLGKLRQLFYERLGNTPNLEKYVEYYKWIDISLSQMIMSLVPASAIVNENIRTVIESHILERNKYWHKFPTIEEKNGILGPEKDFEVAVFKPAPGAQSTPAILFSGDGPSSKTVTSKPNAPDFPSISFPPGLFWANPVDFAKSTISPTPKDDGKKSFAYWITNGDPTVNLEISSGDTNVDSARSDIKRIINSGSARRPGEGLRPGLSISGGPRASTITAGKNESRETGGTPHRAKPILEFGRGMSIEVDTVQRNAHVETAYDEATPNEHPSRASTRKDQYTETIVGTVSKDDVTRTTDPGRKEDSYTEGERDSYSPVTYYSGSSKSGGTASDIIATESDNTTIGDVGGFVVEVKANVSGANIPMPQVDACNPEYETPMQGPFTENYVGGWAYRHVKAKTGAPLNVYYNGALDTPPRRPEFYYMTFGAGKIKVVSVDSINVHYPRATTIRTPGAKRPVNVENIQLMTASNFSGTVIGNYENLHEIVEAHGRSINNRYLVNNSASLIPAVVANLSESTNIFPDILTRGPYVTKLPQASLLFPVPARTGAAHVVTSRFSSPGDYNTLSEGALDLQSGEFTPNNALPFRNRRLLSRDGGGEYYAAGSTLSPRARNETHTIDGVASVNRIDGLYQLLTNHCGKFGTYISTRDAESNVNTSGSNILETTTVTRAHFHKVHRNVLRRMETGSSGPVTASVFDNAFITHPIPRSDRQYSWITKSLSSMEYGKSAPLGYFDRTGLISSSAGEVSDVTFLSASQYQFKIARAHPVGALLTPRFLRDPLIPELNLISPERMPDFSLGSNAGLPGRVYSDGGSSNGGISTRYHFSANNVGNGKTLLVRDIFGKTFTIKSDTGNAHFDGRLHSDGVSVNFGTQNAGSAAEVARRFKTLLNAIYSYSNGIDWISFVAAHTSGSTEVSNRYRRRVRGVSETPRGRHVGAVLGAGAPNNDSFVGNFENFSIGHGTSTSTVPGLGGNTRVEDTVSGHYGSASLLNDLLIHRNGVYGYPTWKQIRNNENPLVRNMISNNRISTFKNFAESKAITNYKWNSGPKEIIPGHDKVSNTTKLTASFKEPALQAKHLPVVHEFATEEEDILEIKHSFGNNLTRFTNLELNDITDYELIQEPQVYNDLTDICTNNNNVGETTEKLDFVSINYSETIWPKASNTFLSRSLGRLKLKELQGTSSRGYDRRVSDIRTFWKDDYGTAVDHLGGQRSLYPNAKGTRRRSVRQGAASNTKGGSGFVALDLFGHPFQKNIFAGANLVTVPTSSMWCLDSFQSASSTTLYTPYLKSSSAGTLNWSPDGAQMFFAIDSVYTTATASVGLFRDPINRGYGNYVASPPRWFTNIIATAVHTSSTPKNPWYNDYETYSEDIRRFGKDHSILPEYRISEHMDYHTTETNSDFTAQNQKFLTLVGGQVSESAPTSLANYDNKFWTDYVHGDFMSQFDVILEDYNEIGEPTSLSLKCSGIKKLLPYNGFYPATRTVQLGTLLSESFSRQLIGFSGTLSNLRPTGNETSGEGGVTVKRGTGATDSGIEINKVVLHHFVKPLMQPGLLFNSLKSGIAVDYPMYTGSIFLSGASAAGWGSPDSVLNTGSNFRLPFETLIDMNFYPKSGSGADNGRVTWVEPYYGTAFSNAALKYTFKRDVSKGKDSRYELAMHNFLGETARLFLRDSRLKYFESKREFEINNIENGKTYFMDVVLEKSNGFVMAEGGMGTFYSYASSSYHQTSGSIYGPPFRWTGSSGLGGNGFSGNSQFAFSDPAYAPHTPPYFYGRATARLAFDLKSIGKSDSSDLTMEQIISGALNHEKTEFIRTFDKRHTTSAIDPNSLAYKQAMQITSSLNLFSLRPGKKLIYDPQGNVVSVEEDLDKKAMQWVISPKMEFPVLNMNQTHQTIPGFDGFNENTGKSIWAGYGKIPNYSDEGIFLSIEESFGSDAGPATGSLSEVLGFKSSQAGKDKLPIGELAIDDEKQLSEAVVAIPYILVNEPKKYKTTNIIADKHFFLLSNQEVKNQMINVEKTGLAVPSKNIKSTSISHMTKMMKKYILPPRLDFVKNKSVSPFVMYIFEFTHNLKRQELADIWQNVMPDIAINAQHEEVEIKHSFGEHDFFHGNPIFMQEENKPVIHWMVFKIKRQAETSYYSLTEDASDDKRFKSLFGGDEKNHYSYNWPYDFCSLVELAKVDASLEISSKTPTVVDKPMPSSGSAQDDATATPNPYNPLSGSNPSGSK